MKNKRTGGMTAVAIINFVFGGGGILVCLFGLVAVSSSMANPMMALAGNAGQAGALLIVMALLSLPPALAAIISGVGILRVEPWGRVWTLVYAILGMVARLLQVLTTAIIEKLTPWAAGASSPVFTIAVGFIYPAILLFLINTRKWKETFAPRSVSSVHDASSEEKPMAASIASQRQDAAGTGFTVAPEQHSQPAVNILDAALSVPKVIERIVDRLPKTKSDDPNQR